MFVQRKSLGVSLVIVASLLLSSMTLAQVRTVPNHDWSELSSVTSGSKLVVKLKNGKTLEGKLTSVSDIGLSLSVRSQPVDLKREDVLSVYQIRKKSAKKATLIGLGVGAAGGAAIGAAGGDSDDFFINRGQLAAGLAVLGGGAGALAGFLVGKSGSKRVLIYETRQP